jgi:hypothetical protein
LERELDTDLRVLARGLPVRRKGCLVSSLSLGDAGCPIEVASAWPFRAIPTEDLGCGG